MKLYNFFRSGTSHRLRIALNLKGVDTEYVPVDVRTDEHATPAYKAINPQGLVPALELEDGTVLTQSPAIIEWLEQKFPSPPLLPQGPEDRARVRAMAAIVGCDVHPVNNKRLLEYLRKNFGADEAAIKQWCGTWISAGFDALESMLVSDRNRGRYCFGDRVTFADIYLVPQAFGARRFDVDLSCWPNVLAVEAACNKLDAFARAAPGVQTDAQ